MFEISRKSVLLENQVFLVFLQNVKNSKQKKLKTAKTQGKFCPKTQGTGAFPNLQQKETQKKLLKTGN